MLGRFLEVSLHAPRILESWRWWQALGFTFAPVGETWRHGYAVATDGRVAVGLHDGAVPHGALAYVRPELARRVAGFEAVGVEFDSVVLGDDRFNEAAFTMPDRQVLRLLEARTWSPPPQAAPSLLGWFEEYALPVADLGAARARWEALGFVAVEERADPWPRLALTSDTLNLGLHRTIALGGPAFLFAQDDVDALRDRLDAAGVAVDPRPPAGLDAREWLSVTSPEGLRLLAGPVDTS